LVGPGHGGDHDQNARLTFGRLGYLDVRWLCSAGIGRDIRGMPNQVCGLRQGLHDHILPPRMQGKLEALLAVGTPGLLTAFIVQSDNEGSANQCAHAPQRVPPSMPGGSREKRLVEGWADQVCRGELRHSNLAFAFFRRCYSHDNVRLVGTLDYRSFPLGATPQPMVSSGREGINFGAADMPAEQLRDGF